MLDQNISAAVSFNRYISNESLTCHLSDYGTDLKASHIVASVFFCIICLCGIIGNSLVFYVVCRFSTMQTITNIFILALAIADMAYLAQIPFLVTTVAVGQWLFGDFYCRIFYVLTTVNQFASSFFLVVMSADRFIAICLPTTSTKYRTSKNAVLTCCLIWTLALICMCPVVLYTKTITQDDTTNCNINWPDFNGIPGTGPKMFTAYCFILGFFLPVIFMLTFYGLVIRKLKSRQAMRQCDSSVALEKRRQMKIKRVSAVITLLISAFLFCWTPYWINQIYITFVYSAWEASTMQGAFSSCEAEEKTQRHEFMIVNAALFLQCLCYANSAVNPLIYAMSSQNFKKSYMVAFRMGSSHHVGSSNMEQIPLKNDYAMKCNGLTCPKGHEPARSSVLPVSPNNLDASARAPPMN